MSSEGFDELSDCIQDILDNDPECEEITFHQQGCVSESEDRCDCAPLAVPVEEVYLLGTEAVASKLTPWLDARQAK